MHEPEMTPFEIQLASRLRAYSAIEVAPASGLAIARDAGLHRRGAAFTRLPARGPLRLALVAALAAALIGAALFLAGRQPSLPPVSPPASAPVPTAPSPSPASLDATLEGTWLADKPGNLSFGDPSGPARMALVFDANATAAFVTVSSSGERARLTTFVSAATEGLRFEERLESDPVVVDGIGLPACPAGGAGTYTLQRSADGQFMTLASAVDACAGRSAVLARTWVRSLAAASGGGPGVVDALSVLFSVSMPNGSYAIDRSPGSITIAQPNPELQLMVIEDPQGFNDPCDAAAGRYVIEPGADAFVAYFEQLEGFTVDSTAEALVDGHRAIRLVEHADLDAPRCPSGDRLEWQPRVETSRSWFLPAGVTDSLYIVELPGSTLLFEVLPAPNAVEDEIIGSIRFHDELPAGP
ncbi:MAG TPA: hypothetical protein VIF63_00740 [Candidatus Limnocylindrales bacterium]